jgi:membrane protease YdiL (CAAX protease family)
MTSTDNRHRLLILALVGIVPFTFNGLVNSIVADNALLYWGFEMLTWVVIPSVIAWLVARTPGLHFADLGFHGSIRGQRNIGLLLAACMLFAPLCYLVYSKSYDFFSGIFPPQGFFQYESVVPESGMLYLVVIVYFALSAGVVEEFLFRGLLFRAFSGFRHSLALFLVLSPLLFSLVHWEDGIANLVSTWIVGLFMALAYLGFRNLWPLVIGHIFTDLVWYG